MRVCHVVPAYPDDAHGHREGQNYRQLLRHLSGGGLSCVAVAARQYQDSPTAEQDGDVAVRRFVFGEHHTRLGELRMTPLRAFRYRRAGRRALVEVHQEAPVDLLHAHTPVPCGLLALTAARRLRAPVALTLHGSDMLIHAQRSAAFRRATGHVLRRVDRVIAVSEQLADAARELVPALRVEVIPIGYDDSVFHSGLPAADRQPIALSTRNLAPLYSVGTLVRAAQTLGPAGEVHVHIYGDGPERGRLEAEGADAPVTFQGFASAAELSHALRHAAIYVSTSPSDGTSVSLLEALACGAYPVVTDIPANRRWVEDGVNGRLVPAGDAEALATALRVGLHDTAVRQRAADANADRVAGAAWSAVVPRLRRLYAELAG